MATNRDDPAALDEQLEPGADMAGRSGLRAHVARSDEHLGQRPDEVLARLARVTRLCAISDALIFPEHPALHARWDAGRSRWVSRTTGEPVDAIALRDRAIHLHARGESAPTAVIPFRKLDDLAQTVLALEEVDRFRRLTSVAVSAHDLGSVVAQLGELGLAVERLTALHSSVPPGESTTGSVEPPSTSSGAPELHLVRRIDTISTELDEPTVPSVPPPPPPLPRDEGQRPRRTLRERLLAVLDLDRRDAGALLWLTIAACVSYGTTWHGASAIGLAPELALLATTFVCGFLWTLLVGAALKHAPTTKLVAELLLASACIYAGFFTYYDGQTRAQREGAAHEQVASAHAQLVSSVYGEHVAELARLAREVEQLERDKRSEIADGGSSTGRAGYGPVAREIAAELREVARQRAQVEGRLEPLHEVATRPIEGLDARAVHELDLAIWAAAPPEWRPARPELDAYVDRDEVPPAYRPIVAVRAGEPAAYVSLACATLVEGIMVFCGFSIERRRRERLIPRLTRAGTRLVREARDARASAAHARQVEARARYAYDLDDEGQA